MTLRKLTPLLGLGLTLIWAGCGEGNLSARLDGDATQARVEMQLTSASSSGLPTGLMAAVAQIMDVPSAGLTVSAAFINIGEIELELPEGMACEDAGFVAQEGVSCETETDMEHGSEEIESEIKIQGPFVFDLLTGASTPDLGALTIPSGVYREVEIKIEKRETPSGTPITDPNLEGNSIYVEGAFTDGSAVDHDFVLALEIDEELEIESEVGFNVLEQSANTVVAGLNVDAWFSGIDLQACVDSGDFPLDSNGDLQLRDDDELTGQNVCENLEETVEDNIKTSFELFEEEHEDDSDDDGEEGSSRLKV